MDQSSTGRPKVKPRRRSPNPNVPTLIFTEPLEDQAVRADPEISKLQFSKLNMEDGPPEDKTRPPPHKRRRIAEESIGQNRSQPLSPSKNSFIQSFENRLKSKDKEDFGVQATPGEMAELISARLELARVFLLRSITFLRCGDPEVTKKVEAEFSSTMDNVHERPIVQRYVDQAELERKSAGSAYRGHTLDQLVLKDVEAAWERSKTTPQISVPHDWTVRVRPLILRGGQVGTGSTFIR